MPGVPRRLSLCPSTSSTAICSGLPVPRDRAPSALMLKCPIKAITSIRSDAQIRELLRRLCLRRFSTHISSAQARSARASDSMLSPRNRARTCFQTAIQLDLPLRAAAYPLVGVRVHRCASRRNPTTLLRSRYSSIQREPHRKRQRRGLQLPWSEFRVCPRIRQWRNSSKEQWRGWSQVSKPRTSKTWCLSNILATTLVLRSRKH